MRPFVSQQLNVARALANLEKRRPRQASLRRAVSTAYYALFQGLCEACVEELVGSNKPWEAITPIFRALDHNSTAQILNSNQGASREVQRLGTCFKELRSMREWADYNPEPRPRFDATRDAAPFTRNEAISLIELAEEALGILERLDSRQRLTLATRLVAKSKK